MPVVQAITSFDHSGPRKRDERFHVSDQHARKLRDAGLVDIVGEGAKANPKKAAGNPSSASPAARLSRKKTASESAHGEKRRRKRKSAEQ